MKATVKKTVLRTVFRERADESIQFALNRSGEVQIPCPPPKLQIPKRVSVIFLPQTQEDKGFEGDSYKKSPAETDG